MAKRILFQGDSITDAGRNREDFYSLGYGYPLLVAAHLTAEHPGEYEYVNRGIGGDLLVDLYNRRQADLLDIQPDYLSVFIGTNDAWAELDQGRPIVTEEFVQMYSPQGYDGVTVVTEPLLAKEEYRLTVADKGVEIASACDEGLFRGATTLRQMIRQTGGEVPCCTIQDKPDIGRRGYMIDISRGKKPRMETIKMMIDFLAELKYNEFQLYMEGDCFKYSAYPKETADFDCLTPDDIEYLDQNQIY